MSTQNVIRLKELLFDTEQARLAELARRLELLAVAERQQREALSFRHEQRSAEHAREHQALDEKLAVVAERAGGGAQFRASVADVLDGAIRDAEIARHKELTRAMAPMVVRTIRIELERSENEILTALYPHTGRMVRDYVASAMRDLVAQINRRLEAGLKQSPVMLRLRSLMTGRPVAELAIAEMATPAVTDMFLIKRGSGELLARWPEGPEFADKDIHLSGVLASINDFALQAFKDGGSSIRTFSSGNSTIFLRATPTTLLAARVSGPELPGSQAIVDEAMIDLTEQARTAKSERGVGAGQGAGQGGVEGPGTAVVAAPPPPLDDLATTLDKRLGAKHAELAVPGGLGFNPLLVLSILVAIPLGAWIAWSFWVDYQTFLARTAADRVIAASSDLKLYRPDVDVGRMGATLRVTALAPTEAARLSFVERLKAELPTATIADEITVLPSAPDLQPRIAEVKREVSAIEERLARTTVERSVGRSETRIGQVLSDLAISAPAHAGRDRARALEDGKARAGAAVADLTRFRGLSAGDRQSVGASIAALHQATEKLRAASAALALIVTGDPPSPAAAAQGPLPDDLLAASEALTAATERLAAVTLVAVQTLKAPPPPAPLAPPAPVTTIIERPPPTPSVRERLRQWVLDHALFFANNTDYRDPETAGARLGELAQLMRAGAGGDVIRIIGYTDERGTTQRNTPLALARAEKVATDLVALGVARERLVTVGRVIGLDISPAAGAQSPNRRVEFAIGFIGEAGGAGP